MFHEKNLMWNTFLVIILIGFTIPGNSFAQADSTKKHLIGSDLSIISGNIPSIHYGIFNKRQSREFTLRGYFLKPEKDLSVYGGGLTLRHYMRKTAKGMYLALGIDINRVKWNYRTATLAEDVQTVLIYPKIEHGYRWSFENGLSLVPNLTLDYQVGEVKARDGNQKLERPESNYSLSFGMDIDFLF